VYDLCPANCKNYEMKFAKILPFMTFAQQAVKILK